MPGGAGQVERDYRESHVGVGESYDSTLTSHSFDVYMARRERRLVERVVRSHFPNGVPRYLDFACGTGRIAEAVAPHAHEAVGVDVAPSMLRSAEAKLPSMRFVQGDITTDDLGLGRFDLITAFRFFGNAQEELRESAAAALARHLAPGGLILLNNHRNPYAIANLLARLSGDGDRMELTSYHLSTLMRRHGLRVTDRWPIGVWKFRGKLMTQPPNEERDERMERIFGAGIFTAIAPDAVLLVRGRDHASR